jgi:hypothetical protein
LLMARSVLNDIVRGLGKGPSRVARSPSRGTGRPRTRSFRSVSDGHPPAPVRTYHTGHPRGDPQLPFRVRTRARQYGLNRATVRKWKRRDSAEAPVRAIHPTTVSAA